MAHDGLDLFPVGGAIDGCDFQGEIDHWGGYITDDPHAEKGTGFHGANIADAGTGIVTDTRLALYVHDGPSGAGVQIGAPSAGGRISGVTLYLKAVNLTMRAQSQVAGNALQEWGAVPIGMRVPYLEANDLEGRASDGEGIYSGVSMAGIQRGVRPRHEHEPEPLSLENRVWHLGFPGVGRPRRSGLRRRLVGTESASLELLGAPEELEVEALHSTGHLVEAELRCLPRGRVRSEPKPLGRVVEQATDGTRKRRSVTGWDKHGLAAVLDDLRDPTDARRDDRTSERHVLEQRERRSFPVGCEHRDIEAGSKRRGIRAEAEERDRVGDSRVTRLVAQRGALPGRRLRGRDGAFSLRAASRRQSSIKSTRFSGRRRPTKPTTGTAGSIASSRRSDSGSATRGAAIPFGITRTLSRGRRSISIMRRASSEDTATIAAARGAITCRSTSMRRRSPVNDQECSCVTRTGAWISGAITAPQAFEPNL